MSAEVIATLGAQAVAIAALLVGWRQHDRGVREGRRHADLANVRTVVDDAAVELHRAAHALDDARSQLRSHGHAFFADEEREKAYHAVWHTSQELGILGERLSIRFGPEHEATRSFRAALDAVFGIYGKLTVLRLEDPADSQDAREQLRAFVKETRGVTEELQETFAAERRAFVNAAHSAAGARLPGEHD